MMARLEIWNTDVLWSTAGLGLFKELAETHVLYAGHPLRLPS